jgi:serine/threonine protein kinase
MPRGHALKSGDVVSGRYQLEEYLGGGGMAFVYRARDRRDGRTCALKFLLPRLIDEEEGVERFLAEAEVAKRIGSHPHIVELYGSGLDERSGLPFLCMEYLAGKTLQALLAERGPQTRSEAKGWLAQLGLALEEAHKGGIVHRDLKPANIFVLDEPQRLKVLDFGIAKLVDHATQSTATQTGTPGYCAPEQLGAGLRALAAERGITISREISPATDVWALALIAYELLTGRRARDYWSAENIADLLVKIALEPREPPSQRAGSLASRLPPGFDAWFLRCVEHDASRRFASAREAVEALGPLLDADVPTLEREAMARAVAPPASVLPEHTLPLEVTTASWSTVDPVPRRAREPARRRLRSAALASIALGVAAAAASLALWPAPAPRLQSLAPLTLVVVRLMSPGEVPAAPTLAAEPEPSAAAPPSAAPARAPRPRATASPRSPESTPPPPTPEGGDKSFDELFGRR